MQLLGLPVRPRPLASQFGTRSSAPAGPGPGPGLFVRLSRPLQIGSASDLLLGTEFECNRIVAMDPSSAAARIG